MTTGPLDPKNIRATVEVTDEAVGRPFRLTLTIDSCVFLVDEISGQVGELEPAEVAGASFTPSAAGGGIFEVGARTLVVRPIFSPTKLAYFLGCLGLDRPEQQRQGRHQLLPPRPPQSGWYADPSGRFAYRFFNSSRQWESLCRRGDGSEVRDTETDLASLNAEETHPPETKQSTALATGSRFSPGVDIAGSNGTVRISGRFIIITRGLMTDLVYGNLRGTKSIPVKSVQAVQLKRATRLVGGALEFVVAGDFASTGRQTVNMGNGITSALVGRQVARMGNENVVTFTLQQQPPFLELHDYLLSIIEGEEHSSAVGSAPRPAAVAGATDLVGQLERLKTLRDEGVLSDEEFASAKARLLG